MVRQMLSYVNGIDRWCNDLSIDRRIDGYR